MNAANEFARLSGKYFAQGALRESAGATRTPVVDPSTARAIGEIANVTPDEVDQVVAAANAAQGHWWGESALHRSEKLHEVAARMRQLRPDVAELMTRETGKPYKESVDELTWSVTATDYYAELGRHSVGSVLGPSVAGQLHYTVKEPMGVVVVVLPANFPILLLMWEAAAALAAGNAVIVKPSEFASLTTLKFMEAFADLPDGLVQCVTGGGQVGEPQGRRPCRPDLPGPRAGRGHRAGPAKASMNLIVVRDANSDGLTITAFPAARAPCVLGSATGWILRQDATTFTCGLLTV